MIIALLTACDGGEGQDPTIQVPETWRDVRRGTGHLQHLREDVKCKDCHAVEGSGFDRPSVLVCAKCHETVRDRTHRSDGAPKDDCFACHEFVEKTEVSKGACARCHDALPIHQKEDCLGCHAPHRDPPLLEESCASCHEQKAFVHAAEACGSCHAGHENKSAAPKTCAQCHQDELGAHRKGHPDCATCHPPHRSPPSCQSCHPNLRRDRHDRCDGCHQPHASQAKAADACASCHADVLVDHGKGGASCGSCHPPHRPVERCTKCHQEAPADTSLHAGKLPCTSCHRPHQLVLERMDRESCSTCHEPQNAAVAEGHGECRDCHLAAPHAPKRPPASCGKCHQAEQRSAPKGHDRCTDCHEPHSGRTAKSCQTCHQQPVNVHTKAGDCGSCHAPHGPDRRVSPASCTSCHTALPQLHKDRGHAKCASCHEPHEQAPRRDRALCESCHSLPNHEPKVATCVGCHPFR